jgi:hypothetical protein
MRNREMNKKGKKEINNKMLDRNPTKLIINC